MKKIVIVTWIGSGNFGTTLQSFALHKKLELLGYNVCILSDDNIGKTWKHYIKYLLSKCRISIKSIKKIVKHESLSSSRNKLKIFISTNYNQIENVYIPSELNNVVRSTDVFVAGSDQIWNTINSFNSFYFLDFVKETKRIAYASSIGIEDFPPKHKPEVKRMLAKFAHIGLREETGVKAVSSLLGRNDIVQVVDPTLLLDNGEWGTFAEKANIEFVLPKRYILCYLIGKNEWYVKQIQKVRTLIGISDIIIVPAIENLDFMIKGAIKYEAAGPLEFIKLIKDAAFVCTDSFHATALSINMSKNFVEFMRFKDEYKASQNSRIYDILGHYNLLSRVYSEKHVEWANDILYEKISSILHEDRIKSLKFLVESIEN